MCTSFNFSARTRTDLPPTESSESQNYTHMVEAPDAALQTLISKKAKSSNFDVAWQKFKECSNIVEALMGKSRTRFQENWKNFIRPRGL